MRLKSTLSFLVFVSLVTLFVPAVFAAEKIPTKVIVRVVARDAQVIGSGVGGALVRIKNLETGEVLAEGKQEGGTGSTERIMVQPRRRGETVYGTSSSAYFEAKVPLDRPTQVQIDAEAPLGYPQAIQKASKTLTLVPGKDVLGEGIIIELNGLIVNIQSPSSKESLKGGEAVLVKAEVRMLWGCSITPGGLWDSNKFEVWGQWIYENQISDKFNLNYAGKASLFEGKTTLPPGLSEAKLQILAADQSNNFGQQIVTYRLSQ